MQNKMNDNELLSAYIDNELSAEQRDQVDLRLTSEPLLLSRLDRLQRLNNDLHDAVTAVDLAPPCARTAALLNQPKSQKWYHKWGNLLYTCSAAAVLLTAIVITYWSPLSPNSQLASVNPLDAALNQAVAGSSVKTDIGTVTEIFAYIRTDGTLCKQYTLNGPRSIQGVACYEQQRWTNAVSAPWTPPTGQFQPAGVGNTPLADYVQATLSGTSLSADEERKLMQSILQKP